MTLMERGASWLIGKLQTAGGGTITYEPHTSPPLTVTGVLKEVSYDVIDDAGTLTKVTVPVWLIPASELGTVKPVVGHELRRAVDGVTETYRAVPNDKMKQVASLDATGTIWTIQTQKVVSG